MSRKDDTREPEITISTEHFIPVQNTTPHTQLEPASPADRVKIPAGKRKAGSKTLPSARDLINSGEMLGAELHHPHHGR